MSEETTVTRGNQITLTKDVRDKLNIREGDRIILNIMGGALMVSKRNSKVFDSIKGFLPEKFDRILEKIRSDEGERLKRFGMIE